MLLHTGHVGILHLLRTDVAAAQKFAVVIELPAYSRRVSIGQLRPAPLSMCDLGIALEHFEARVEQMDAIEYGLQLGRFIHHMHRRGDLAAVVQQSGDLQFVAVFVGQVEILADAPCLLELAASASIMVKCRNALAMSAGIRRFIVDGGVDEADQGFEQIFQLLDQAPVADGDGSLRSQRFEQLLVVLGEMPDLAGRRHP